VEKEEEEKPQFVKERKPRRENDQDKPDFKKNPKNRDHPKGEGKPKKPVEEPVVVKEVVKH
jgi:hypothetical protein